MLVAIKIKHIDGNDSTNSNDMNNSGNSTNKKNHKKKGQCLQRARKDSHCTEIAFALQADGALLLPGVAPDFEIRAPKP